MRKKRGGGGKRMGVGEGEGEGEWFLAVGEKFASRLMVAERSAGAGD